MDRHAIGMLIPVIGILFTGLILFSFTRLGRAVAHRIEGGDPSRLQERMGQLESESELLRAELAEMQERLDFAERTLARTSVPEALPPA